MKPDCVTGKKELETDIVKLKCVIGGEGGNGGEIRTIMQKVFICNKKVTREIVGYIVSVPLFWEGITFHA